MGGLLGSQSLGFTALGVGPGLALTAQAQPHQQQHDDNRHGGQGPGQQLVHLSGTRATTKAPIIAPPRVSGEKSGDKGREGAAFVTPQRGGGSALGRRQLAGDARRQVGVVTVAADGQRQHDRQHRHDERGGELEAGGRDHAVMPRKRLKSVLKSSFVASQRIGEDITTFLIRRPGF
ncbi:hypothetical protein OSTOST_09537 [Ostertagia ostertagi]